jgi:putative acetyltransferase
MTIRLRLATPDDAPAIAALFSDSFRLLDFLPELHTREEDLAFIRDNVVATQRVTVAEHDGEIVGFMAEADGFIDHLYVDKAHLGEGVGSRLIADAQARCESLELWCFAENRRARAFYEGRDFVAVEFTDGAGNESKAPDVRYAWRRPGRQHSSSF